MKSISWFTILLIVIVIVVVIFVIFFIIPIVLPAILYAYSTAKLSEITSSAKQQVNQLYQNPSFSIANVYCSNNTLYFTVYNNGYVSIFINESLLNISEGNNVISVNGSDIICKNNVINSGELIECYLSSNYECVYNPNAGLLLTLSYNGYSAKAEIANYIIIVKS